jgi:hypothetical protein
MKRARHDLVACETDAVWAVSRDRANVYELWERVQGQILAEYAERP